MFAQGIERAEPAGRRCRSVLLLAALVLMTHPSSGAGLWGGSLDVTSDYFVRGISRSDDRAAPQLDLHYLDGSGFLADFFASSSQIDPAAKRDAELSAFLGYVWSASRDWQGKLLAGNYSYPWNQAGSQYNYDEVDLEGAFRDRMHVIVSYSPDMRRYLYNRGFVRIGAESLEADVQRPIAGRLSANGGVGYYELNGPQASGYAYWSLGAVYDLAPVSFLVSYIGASRAANDLFYNAAVGGRWSGTVIWRF